MLIRVIESLPIMVAKLQFQIILVVLISYHIVLLQIQLVHLEQVPIMDKIFYFLTHDICITCQSPTTIPCQKISQLQANVDASAYQPMLDLIELKIFLIVIIIINCEFVRGPYCTNKTCISTSGMTNFNHKTCSQFIKEYKQFRFIQLLIENMLKIKKDFFYSSHQSSENQLFQCTVNSANIQKMEYIILLVEQVLCEESRIQASAPTSGHILGFAQKIMNKLVLLNMLQNKFSISIFNHSNFAEQVSNCLSQCNKQYQLWERQNLMEDQHAEILQYPL
ncbi:unnamed protein product [Paramecium sonneborni]|uniref:Transmembrane protein n=1 Tax=Paramecium sonneborni TaxID=65129 RepID=A0A8S1RME9_9CILI|nr:unnamed protein product [Paramecium sonneborni]